MATTTPTVAAALHSCALLAICVAPGTRLYLAGNSMPKPSPEQRRRTIEAELRTKLVDILSHFFTDKPVQTDAEIANASAALISNIRLHASAELEHRILEQTTIARAIDDIEATATTAANATSAQSAALVLRKNETSYASAYTAYYDALARTSLLKSCLLRNADKAAQTSSTDARLLIKLVLGSLESHNNRLRTAIQRRQAALAPFNLGGEFALIVSDIVTTQRKIAIVQSEIARLAPSQFVGSVASLTSEIVRE